MAIWIKQKQRQTRSRDLLSPRDLLYIQNTPTLMGQKKLFYKNGIGKNQGGAILRLKSKPVSKNELVFLYNGKGSI